MGSGGGQGWGAVGVQLLMLRIGILFILNSVIGASIIMGWGLVRDRIGYYWEKHQ